MVIVDRNIDWDLIEDIKSPGSAVTLTRKGRKPVDMMLERGIHFVDWTFLEEKEHASIENEDSSNEVTDLSDTVDKKVTHWPSLTYSNNGLTNRLDLKGRSPVFDACRWDNLRALKLLLEAGFDPVQEDQEGLTMFQVAMAPENYANDCALYLLSISKEVRRRAEVKDEDRERNYVVISYDGKEKIIVDRNIDWDVIEDIKNSGSQSSEGSAVTKVVRKPQDIKNSGSKTPKGSAVTSVIRKPASRRLHPEYIEPREGHIYVPLPGLVLGFDLPSFMEEIAEWERSLGR